MAQRFFTSVKAFEAEAVPTPSVAELGLIAAVRNGEPYEHASARPTAPTRDNTVRASLLRLLITGATPDCGLQPFGVWLEGAWIDGMLDLRFCKAQGRTVLKNCHFKDAPQLDQAHLKELSVQGSMLDAGLFAQGAKIGDSVVLDGVKAVGTIDLNRATIGGQLSCVGASLSGPRDAEGAVTGLALNAQGAKIGDSVFLREVEAVGTIDFNRATIDGQLACEGATLSGPRDAKGAVTGHALHAQGAMIGDSVFLRRVKAVGTIDFNRATIGGQLSCVGASLSGPRDAEGAVTGRALHAQGAKIVHSVVLDGVKAVGTIDLNAATIGGPLACEGATLSGPRDADGAITGKALNAEMAKIGGHVLLREMRAMGTVNLLGAAIGGQLAFEGGSFSGPRDADGAVKGVALLAQSVAITEGLFFRNVASVAGDIDLTNGQCRVLWDDAESWERCDGDLYLDSFTYDRIAPQSPTILAARRAWLRRGATLRGSFYPQPYTQFAKVLSETGHGAEARRVRIAAVEHRVELQVEEVKALRRFIRSLRGVVKAPNTQTMEVMQSCAADLSADAQVEAKRRHDRTGATLRGMAETDEQERAFAVRGLSNDLSRRALGLQVWRIWLVLRDRILRWTIGYGFAPARSLWTLAGLIATAWLLAHLAWEEGSFAPGSGPILLSEGWASVQAAANPAAVWSADTALGGDWESFSAPAYAFDVVVPLIDIGQTQAWAPSTERGPVGFVLWWARWILTVLGWVVTALGAAAVTGIVQRGQPE